MKIIKHYTLLGVNVDALTIQDLNELITSAITNDESWVIANHNFHSISLYHHDEKMRMFYALARYVHIDGMSLIFTGRMLGLPLERVNRVTPVDWLRPLVTEAASRGWRIFYLGSKPGIAEKGAQILRNEFPELIIQTRHGFFDASPSSVENHEVIEQIRQYHPHILMVGMGMPRQEHWIVDNIRNLPVNVILNVGALIDYVAGAISTPPRWMGQIGLEWLYRLLSEPRRLWKRYLIEPWYVFGLLCRDLWETRIRRSPRENNASD